MSTAHNKLTKDEVDKYCQSNDIRFIDDEYVSNAFKHRWYCNKCCRTVTQRLDKIKRANGTLKCCSRTLASVNKAYSIAEKFNLIFHRESFYQCNKRYQVDMSAPQYVRLPTVVFK